MKVKVFGGTVALKLRLKIIVADPEDEGNQYPTHVGYLDFSHSENKAYPRQITDLQFTRDTPKGDDGNYTDDCNVKISFVTHWGTGVLLSHRQADFTPSVIEVLSYCKRLTRESNAAKNGGKPFKLDLRVKINKRFADKIEFDTALSLLQGPSNHLWYPYLNNSRNAQVMWNTFIPRATVKARSGDAKLIAYPGVHSFDNVEEGMIRLGYAVEQEYAFSKIHLDRLGELASHRVCLVKVGGKLTVVGLKLGKLEDKKLPQGYSTKPVQIEDNAVFDFEVFPQGGDEKGISFKAFKAQPYVNIEGVDFTFIVMNKSVKHFGTATTILNKPIVFHRAKLAAEPSEAAPSAQVDAIVLLRTDPAFRKYHRVFLNHDPSDLPISNPVDCTGKSSKELEACMRKVKGLLKWGEDQTAVIDDANVLHGHLGVVQGFPGCGKTTTEKRLRSNGHAKKFLRLNNVRGVGP
jgi:hypothetical protein